jgi:hypothetical protein
MIRLENVTGRGCSEDPTVAVEIKTSLRANALCYWNRVQRARSMKTAMNRRSTQEAGNFSTSWVTITFSWKAELRYDCHRWKPRPMGWIRWPLARFYGTCSQTQADRKRRRKGGVTADLTTWSLRPASLTYAFICLMNCYTCLVAVSNTSNNTPPPQLPLNFLTITNFMEPSLVAGLVKKLSTCYGIGRFIAMLTRPHDRSLT